VHFTGVKKTPFSSNCSSTLPEQKHMNFSVQISSGWGTSNSEFEVNPLSCSQDMHLQFIFLLLLLLYAALFEVAITFAYFNG